MRKWIYTPLLLLAVLAAGYGVLWIYPDGGLDPDAQQATPAVPLDDSSIARDAKQTASGEQAQLSLDGSNASGMSLVHVLPTLRKQGRVNGDVAIRLSHDLMICHERLVESAIAEGMLTHGQDGTHMPLPQVKKDERVLGQIGDRLVGSDALCESVDDEFIRDAAFEVLLGAAKAGSEAAAACFVSGELFPVDSDAIEKEQLLARYRATALELARAGVERGDWRMVRLMALMHSAGGNAFVRSLAPQSDVAVYSWLRLARLGAAGKEADRLDRGLTAVGRRLSADAVKDADAWAIAMFSAHFSGRPGFTDARATSCITQDDRAGPRG